MRILLPDIPEAERTPLVRQLLGEVIRLLLEAYYEPTFSDRSHGFRPGRGCHTALREVADTWTGTTWFIEGDVADCFGSFDHEIMLSTLAEKIHDNRFLRLIENNGSTAGETTVCEAKGFRVTLFKYNESDADTQ